MTASNTASTFAFDNDTYRSNERPQQADFKIRIATEYTGEDYSGNGSVATINLPERYQYRLASKFGRKVISRAHVMPSVIDDIKQRFSGVVTGIDHENEEFTARISDVKTPDNPDELITLSFDEIQDADRRQLTIGDSFVWYIGYVQGQMVSREGFSKIRFRRLREWSQHEIDAATSLAEELAYFFRRDTDTSS